MVVSSSTRAKADFERMTTDPNALVVFVEREPRPIGLWESIPISREAGDSHAPAVPSFFRILVSRCDLTDLHDRKSAESSFFFASVLSGLVDGLPPQSRYYLYEQVSLRQDLPSLDSSLAGRVGWDLPPGPAIGFSLRQFSGPTVASSGWPADPDAKALMISFSNGGGGSQEQFIRDAIWHPAEVPNLSALTMHRFAWRKLAALLGECDTYVYCNSMCQPETPDPWCFVSVRIPIVALLQSLVRSLHQGTGRSVYLCWSFGLPYFAWKQDGTIPLTATLEGNTTPLVPLL